MKTLLRTSPSSDNAEVALHPISMLGPIFGSHIKRIGIWRVIIGGGSMYLYLPFMILIHTTFAVLMYQWLLRPLLGLPRVHWEDHVIIDRHRIEGLTWFDKFNCMFCGYANGVCTMMNQEMDHLSQFQDAIPFYKKPLVMLISLLLGGFMIIGEPMLQIIFNILVSRPLGMHRVSIRAAQQMLSKHHYGATLPLPLKTALLICKNHTLRFSMALEQIESSWCPLVHFEKRQGIIYPNHHRKFFGADEIREMNHVLRTVGTVSDRLPTW